MSAPRPDPLVDALLEVLADERLTARDLEFFRIDIRRACAATLALLDDRERRAADRPTKRATLAALERERIPRGLV